MSSKGFRERFLEVYEDGAALASSTTQTSLLPASAKEFTIGAGKLRIGYILAFEFSGRISTVVTTPRKPLSRVPARLSGCARLRGIPLNVTAQTNVHWSLKVS